MQIGDTLYRFDENHRVYARDENGRAHGGPIYSEYFVPFKISGETPRSWLCGDDGRYKISKRELREAGKGGMHGYQWFTEETKDDRLWSAHHRHKIIRLCESALPARLKKIAEIVGYNHDDVA